MFIRRSAASRGTIATAVSLAAVLLVAGCAGGGQPNGTGDTAAPATSDAVGGNAPAETTTQAADLSSLDALPLTDLFPAADALGAAWVQAQAPTEQDLSVFQGDLSGQAAQLGLSEQCAATFTSLFTTIGQSQAADQVFDASDGSGTAKLELYRHGDDAAAASMLDSMTSFATDCAEDAAKLGSFGVTLVPSSIEGAQGFEATSDGTTTYRTMLVAGNYAMWTLAPSSAHADELAEAHRDALLELAG